jgi:hypothetical protein
MSYFSRPNCLALLVLLLLSHAALTLHVTTHIPVDQTKCEYCAGHAKPAHALPAPQAELARSFAVAIEFVQAAPVPRIARQIKYRERAPPVFV